MSHKIGIDFGAANSTISYVEDGGKSAAFRCPGPDGYEYIPSCVAFDPDGDMRIGRAALDFARLISEPVAAAAYYADRHQQATSESFTGNLLTCDMGGGTFDMTLCRVTHRAGEELSRAGVRFDRRLIADGMKLAGKSDDENDPDFIDACVKLQEYKVNNHADTTKRVKSAVEDPDLREKPILRAGRLSFNCHDIQAAFADIQTGILQVLERVKAAIDEKGHGVDAPPGLSDQETADATKPMGIGA